MLIRHRFCAPPLASLGADPRPKAIARLGCALFLKWARPAGRYMTVDMKCGAELEGGEEEGEEQGTYLRGGAQERKTEGRNRKRRIMRRGDNKARETKIT